jgi:tetratricopeptide (TPR) repeat protein
VSWAQGLRSGALSLAAPDAVPADVAQSIRQRIDALPPPVRELLGAAAVIGRRAPRLPLLAVARELDYRERETPDALEAAVRARLLLEDGEDGYQFAHDPVREVIGQDLSAARRATLHRYIAARLEASPGAASAARIAYHYLRSDEQQKAFSHLLKAAEQAHMASAYREETAFLGDALARANRQENAVLAADLHLRRARAFLPLAFWVDADRELDLALAILPPEEKERRIQTLLERAQVSHWLHDPAEIRRYAQPALALADEAGRDDLAAQAMCRLALADSSEGFVRASVEEYERAFARAGEEAAVVAGVEYSGLDLYWLGEYDAAVARGRKAVALARESQEIIYLARGLGNLGLALTGDGQYDEALRVFEEARHFARDQQLSQWLARATTMRGGLSLEIFDYLQAETIAEEAREIGRSCGWPQAIASAGMDLLLNYARRGEADERVERILPEVVEATQSAHGEHGWLWRVSGGERRCATPRTRSHRAASAGVSSIRSPG